VWLVLRKGVVQLAIGLAIGLALAALAAGPLQIILYQVQARDPVVFGGVAATLALVGFAASFIPARRVARVNPVVALNAE
jgi:ABC-type antimicrobial peptide transport system permease subunit